MRLLRLDRTGWAVVLAEAGLLFGCGVGSGTNSSPRPQFTPPPPLRLSAFETGLNLPVGFEVPDDGTNRIFIVEQAGTIRIIQAGSLLPAAFMDVTSKVESGGEKGLLGLAFQCTQRPLRHPGLSSPTACSWLWSAGAIPRVSSWITKKTIFSRWRPSSRPGPSPLKYFGWTSNISTIRTCLTE